MIYYFCTTRYQMESMKLSPRIPKTISENENCFTKRICVSPSIQGCLSSIGQNIHVNSNVYVYSCNVSTNELYQPTLEDVYDSHITGEMWLKDDTEFKLEYILRIEKRDHFRTRGLDIYNFRYAIEEFI